MAIRRNASCGAATALALTGCGETALSALDPAGPGSQRIADLTWLLAVTGAIATVAFVLALAYALFRRRPAPPPSPTPERDRRATRWIVLLGAAVPTAVLVPVFAYTMHTVGALDPDAARPDLVVEVVGKQWWWDIRYLDPDPARGFRTANELHVPVGKRVEVRLLAADVIHSFWVPELQGKMDLIPGRRNVTWIAANRAGVYGGQCAEYCGTQHAHMRFLVVAQDSAEFAAWAARQRRGAAEPRDSVTLEARDVFNRSACAFCHAVRGTQAGGAAGPDLTHVATRRTIASGIRANTPGHMAGWIANPQAIKPGTLMPKIELEPDQFRLILHYLRTLE